MSYKITYVRGETKPYKVMDDDLCAGAFKDMFSAEKYLKELTQEDDSPKYRLVIITPVGEVETVVDDLGSFNLDKSLPTAALVDEIKDALRRLK